MPIEHILYTDNLRTGTDKINSAIDQANKAETDSIEAKTSAQQAINTANEANAKSDSTQEQLNNIIINSATSDAETIQARTNEVGKSFDNLRDHIVDIEKNYVDATWFGASGSTLETTGSITAETNLLTVTDVINFKVGQGVLVKGAGTDGVSEVASLQITSNATTDGNVTVTLDGVPTNIPVLTGDITTQIADKIRNTNFTGWTTGGTVGSDTVTFTANDSGVKQNASYSPGTTGASGVMNTVTEGENGSDLISEITGITGTTLTLLTNASTTVSNANVKHDDTIAIQRAIDYVIANNTKEITLPNGLYNIQTLTDADKVTFIGDGEFSKNEYEVENISKHTSQLKSNTFNKYTYGTFENAAVLSAIANNPNPTPQVLGLKTGAELSTYSNRDSVAHYVSNRSTTPTVMVETGTILYSNSSVQISGTTVDLSQVKENMIIDTLHTPNRWTAFVDSVDVENQIIYTKDGWYEVKSGGSTSPTLPPNNIGFYVNWITKIWGLNTNVFLYPQDKTASGVANEIGIFNEKSGSSLGGYDFVNFGSVNGAYAVRVRKATNSPGTFTDGLIAQFSNRAVLAEDVTDAAVRARRTKVGLVYEANIAPDASAILVTDPDGGIAYEVSGIGRLKSLSFQNKTWDSTSTTVDFKQAYLHLLTASAGSTYNVISPQSMTGRNVKVFPFQNVTLNISGNGNFVKAGGDAKTLSCSSKVSVELYSDGSNWYVL